MAVAKRKDDESEAPVARRILIAEDSSVTQDLLKLVLGRRGHRVDIVDDGRKALEAVNQQPYDVVIVDFHLPELDGVEVVRSFLAQNKSSRRPRFVAVTADIEGLLAHKDNCECFDKVVPKPVDIQQISDVVEEQGNLGDLQRSHNDNATTASTSAPPAPKAEPEPGQHAPRQTHSIFHQNYRLLQWPEDFNSKHLSARTLQAGLHDSAFDAIVITQPARRADLALLWQSKGLHLLPVIDLTGCLGDSADLDASVLSRDDAEKIEALIRSFHERRALIHRDIYYTNDLGHKILSRMIIADQTLTPRYDAASPTIVAYNTVLESAILIDALRKLAAEGFVTPSFFDRVHVCANCGSSQFNVREECSECRSSNLKEDAYLHHFKCAYQGPESDFRSGDNLICPKCRRDLSHFGHDYDKPGSMIVCGACNHKTSEPVVGFVCLNCTHRTEGDAMKTRDIFGYELTDHAIKFIEAGQSHLGLTQKTFRFAELPLDLVIALNEQAKRFNDDGTPFALLDISYTNEREIDKAHGARMFSQLRNQFLENLRTVLTRQMRLASDIKIVKGLTYDFALLKETAPETVRPKTKKIATKAKKTLRIDPGAAITVFGQEDLS